MHLQPGDTFGRYTIQRQLGAGGMGVVYHAVDTRLGRAVALKLVRADAWGGPGDVYARTRGAGRLVDEARAAALLDHPNAVHLRRRRGQRHAVHRDGAGGGAGAPRSRR